MNNKFRSLAWILLAAVIASCGGSSGGGDGGGEEKVSGLDARPANLSCIAPARPVGPDILGFEAVFNDAWSQLGAITKILKEPGNSDRWFVLDREGGVFVFSESDPGTVTDWLPALATEVTAEAINGGLLGMAFHPDYPDTPEVFFFYNAVPFIDGGLVVTRVALDSTDLPVAPIMQRVLMIDQYSQAHQGGDIQFGPDGYLYVAPGDGGRLRQAQRTTNFLGAMLRIDVEGTGAGYEIPATDPPNPFSANAKCGSGFNAQDCPEIFAWGFRNPYRWGFDVQDRLWLGDAGEQSWEEINLVTIGSNYGWPCKEGLDDFIPDACNNNDI
ncbi:MAG: PQQ-dependent sugar dehydrogenase, partial [Gammaproteobacteria bacterium]|nr:PQQ-dependent sugar dehydrogenase [Gammaproteobacteria bacterium]